MESRNNVADPINPPDEPAREPASGPQEQILPPEPPATPRARKRAQVPLEEREKQLAPRPSIWPPILALTLLVACVGVMISPILLAVGVVLAIAAIVGWALEKH